MVQQGAAAPSARVVARGEQAAIEGTSDDAGRFSLELPPGSYLLSASLGDASSELVGPILIEAGQRRDDLVLELLPSASVSGVVLDALTRRPVAGATLTSVGGTTRTDDAGRFRLTGLPAREAWVDAQAPGYVQRVEWLSLSGAREHSEMQIFLRPAGVVRGTVVRQGAPVAGAIAWAESVALNAPERVFGPVSTDAEGRFELAAEGGTVQLAAAAPGGSRVEGPRVALTQGEARDGVVIELGAEWIARGLLLVDGQPAAGAELLLLDGKTGRVAGATVSGEGGSFELKGVAPGSYLVQVRRGALSAQRGPYDLTGIEGEDWVVEVDAGRVLAGRVVPPSAGVVVRWRSGAWAGTHPAQTSTDADGTFRFEGVSDGVLTVEAEGPAGSAVTTARASEEVVLELRPSVLQGLVTDERGHPITDFTVELRPKGGGATRSHSALSPTGDFRFEVPPGEYTVSATAPGYGEPAEAPLIRVGGGEVFVRLSLSTAVELKGRVVDASTQEPLAGVEVAVNRMGRDRRRFAGRWATVTTGSDGTFALGAVATQAVLALRKAGYLSLWAPIERVPRDADGRLVLALRPGTPRTRSFEPYEGIGAQLTEQGKSVQVFVTFEGSPAQAAGLLPGDEILSVNGESVEGLPVGQVVQRILGPAGTVVRLTVRRNGVVLDFLVRRRAIQF